jgi:hypothetical protein
LRDEASVPMAVSPFRLVQLPPARESHSQFFPDRLNSRSRFAVGFGIFLP